LNDLVKQGVFREDFYYRLCVLKLRLPTLNERREDIPELTRCFLNQANLHPCSITEEALELLASGEWRGNIRQLSNIVERLAVMCDNGIIDKKLVLEVADDIAMPSGDHLAESLSAAADNGILKEKEFIRRALSKMNGNKAAAAKQLGISTTTLWRKMKKIIENEPYYFDLIRYKK